MRILRTCGTLVAVCFAVMMTEAANRVARFENGMGFVADVEKALKSGADYDAFVFRVKSGDDKDEFSRAVEQIRQARPATSVIAVYLREDAAWRAIIDRLIIAPYCDGPEKENAYVVYIVSVNWGVDRKHPKYLALSERANRRTQRLHDSKWGVFNHFLGHGCRTAEEWNAKVNGFDVKALGERLSACGARFYFITIMQGRRWMLAPNATYDRICGTKPGEACAKRDLVLELSEELERRGIDLYLYYTGDGPYLDPELGPKMGLVSPRIGGVDRRFVENWAAVLEEYAVRYGKRVKGWWVDGCYEELLKYNDDLLDVYTAAIRKGSGEAIVAYNNGVREYFTAYGRSADFTAGEFNDFYAVPKGRFVNGQQAFALIPLGDWTQGGDGAGWCSPGMKISSEKLVNYVRTVNERGGVVAIDVRINPDSSWDADQFEALKALKPISAKASPSMPGACSDHGGKR